MYICEYILLTFEYKLSIPTDFYIIHPGHGLIFQVII